MALTVAGPPLVAGAAAVVLDLSEVATLVLLVVAAAVAVVLTVRAVLRPIAHDAVDARLAGQDADERIRSLRTAVALRDRFDAAAAAEGAEAGVLRLLVRAATELEPMREVSLLLSLPDEPRVAWSVRMVDDELVPAVPVPGRPGCVALASGRTATVSSSHELGACEHLRETGGGSADRGSADRGSDDRGGSADRGGSDVDAAPAFDVSAVCIPLSLADRTLGLLCVTGPPGEPPGADDVATLEHLVATTGRRLGELRRRRGPSTPGPTDPVTGLPSEVALRSRAGELARSHVPYCMAIVRIDGADAYRRDHGPAGWDDALRLVADTTSTTLRPDDVVCRLDGERIAGVLSNCSTAQAAAALERVRESLVLALTVAGIAHFTCSVGLVDGARATSIDEAVRLADAAGEAALLQGGNRVVVADSSIA
ncbi:GGDEF domain-containing protein [Dermatobacter hominis]|uniref:GGDEF domain-containing protein n=1 Tax=Dermatobacter hominis TaxID=2884263 RepID=UPI001D10F30B|nr:GGDEF domain-containing protein [Dermatobacter hominis]UDY37327.1 GGDEF domain-containing protein [Dermatobacter hominis]